MKVLSRPGRCSLEGWATATGRKPMSFVIHTTTLRDVVSSPNLLSCQSLHSAVVKGGWSTCNSPPGSHAGGNGGLPVCLMRVFPGKHRQPLSFTYEALCAIKEKTSGSLYSKQQWPPSKHLPCLFKMCTHLRFDSLSRFWKAKPVHQTSWLYRTFRIAVKLYCCRIWSVFKHNIQSGRLKKTQGYFLICLFVFAFVTRQWFTAWDIIVAQKTHLWSLGQENYINVMKVQ